MPTRRKWSTVLAIDWSRWYTSNNNYDDNSPTSTDHDVARANNNRASADYDSSTSGPLHNAYLLKHHRDAKPAIRIGNQLSGSKPEPAARHL